MAQSFEYAPFNAAPYAASVAELLAHQHDAAARAAIATGEAQAGARAANGDVWGRTIANVAQIPQQIMQQRRLEQDSAQRRELQAQQIENGKAQASTRLQTAAEKEQKRVVGMIGFDAEKSPDAAAFVSRVQERARLGLLPKDTAAHLVERAQSGDWPTMQSEYVGFNAQFQEALKTREIRTRNADGSETVRIVEDKPGQFESAAPPATKRPPTEAELAAIATDPARPQAERDAAKAAMALLKPAPNRTAEQDDAKYRDIIARGTQRQPVTPEDAAWASAYEKQKTLGVDKSAGAASDRQANAIAAQTAQQTRAQGFTEAQAGRKELTEKVEAPFRQAQQSAQELRDLVHLAQSGNKEAASLQALQATMSTVRANGLNRLNQAEMRLPAEAGSLWDKVQGRMGKLVSGQPIDGALQKDLLELADFLEKGAYNRYATAHKDVTTRYKLGDEKPAAPPAGYFSIAAPDGKTYTFPSQDAMDAFKKSAGIR